ADDDQLTVSFGDRRAANRAIAAVDQLDVGLDACFLERLGDCLRNLGVPRGRAALAIDENWNAPHRPELATRRAHVTPSRSTPPRSWRRPASFSSYGLYVACVRS